MGIFNIKHQVSGKRNRVIEFINGKKIDLDLTYITDRVVGMSFPASSTTEKFYRNDIDQVAEFFNYKHGDKYKVFNMSNRDIDESKFAQPTISYPWQDHHSPALSLLFESCEEMFKWLDKHKDNIVAVNCNAGKGRTGTSISCLLLYTELADNFLDAITYYGWMRFSTGRGVSQPSQQRYVQYFDMALKQ